MSKIYQNEIIQKLKAKLRDYILLKGYEFNKDQVSCPILSCRPNHRNKDTHKSAGLVPGTEGKVVHCFTSGKSYNIFQLASEYEGITSDQQSEEFWTITIPFLCNLLGVEYEEKGIVITPQIEEASVHRKIYEYIRKCFANGLNADVIEYAKSRNIEESHYIGCIDSWRNLLAFVNKPEEYLESLGLTNYVINTKRLILAVKNKFGQIDRFESRCIDESSPKYLKIRDKKSNRVPFGIDIACKYRPSLWVVEGPIDVITMQNIGKNNVIAREGKGRLTPELIDELRLLDFSEIVICYDGDVHREIILEEIKSLISSGMRIKVAVLPENEDPDSMGDKMNSIIPMDAIDYYIESRLLEFEESSHLAIEASKLISECTVPLLRMEMVQILAKRLEVNEYDLGVQVQYYINERETKLNSHVIKLFKDISKKVETDPVNVDMYIKDFQESIKRIKPVASRQQEYLGRLNEYIADLNNAQYGSERIRLPTMPRLDASIGYGIPKEQCYIAIGGGSHHGKTTILRSILWNSLRYNEDTVNLMFSLDDNFTMTLTWIIAKLSGLSTLDVRNYNFIDSDKEKRRKISDAISLVKTEWKNRLIISDQREGGTLVRIRQEIEQHIEKYQDKKVVVFIDTIHKLGIHGIGTDLHSKVTWVSNALKIAANEYKVPIVLTAQLRKSQGRPTPQDLAETNQINIDSDLLIMVYNDITENKQKDALVYWIDPKDPTATKRPAIEATVHKNKICEGFSPTIVYKITGNSVVECSRAEQEREFASIFMAGYEPDIDINMYKANQEVINNEDMELIASESTKMEADFSDW